MNPVTFIKINLSLFGTALFLFAKFYKVWPGKSLLIFKLWKIRSELPPHRQFCHRKITPGKGSSPLFEECHVWITSFLE